MSESESDLRVSSPEETDKKRKRSKALASDEEELEIDVNLPEPPSKKARRKEKKQAKSKKSKADAGDDVEGAATDAAPTASTDAAASAKQTPQRSEHGIWIGNLPFAATPDKLREFFADKGNIAESDISRLNMPTTGKPAVSGFVKLAPPNRGFAYVDFASREAQEKAIALSETLLIGRRVLIKDAKSFAGRPQPQPKEAGAEAAASGGKEPSKKVFVGNLAFDVTKDDLTDLLSKAGNVADCFLATFEDTGKCKGFGWVRFADIEGAKAAVRGYITAEMDDEGEEPEEEDSGKTKKKALRKRIYINKLYGRALRCEFAEDAQTRYKKRFGKDAPKTQAAGAGAGEETADGAEVVEFSQNNAAARKDIRPQKRERNMDKDQRRDERRKRHDARTIAPGKTLANAPRASAAIVEAKGKKISFDE